MIRFAVVAAFTVSACASPARQPSTQQVPAQQLDWNGPDSASAVSLRDHGRRIASSQVVVFAPVDLMPASHQAALVDTLEQGVAELRRLIGGQLAWQRIEDRPIQYYLVPDSIISHAGDNDAVFIAVHRALNGTAPYLHEASHQLLAPPAPFYESEYADSAQAEAIFQAWPLWLTEGLPDVLAQMAASTVGLHEGDVFQVGGLAKADSTCAARLAPNQYRADILRVIGNKGYVDALFTTERRKVAPTFYPCAQSMTKYLVDAIGMERTVALFPAIKAGNWAEAIERSSGMSLAVFQARWQARLGLFPQ
ncbi:MAG: hypothetical protein ABI679_15745 [Gemmatimonadota bacterium]